MMSKDFENQKGVVFLLYVMADNCKMQWLLSSISTCIYFILFLFMVFPGELECSDINQHRQPLLHLFKKNGEVVHAFRVRSFERNWSKQQFDVPLNGVFQPPNILSVPPNTLTPNGIPQPLTNPRESFCSGVAFKTQYASA